MLGLSCTPAGSTRKDAQRGISSANVFPSSSAIQHTSSLRWEVTGEVIILSYNIILAFSFAWQTGAAVQRKKLILGHFLWNDNIFQGLSNDASRQHKYDVMLS